jgi:hypothetical protein
MTNVAAMLMRLTDTSISDMPARRQFLNLVAMVRYAPPVATVKNSPKSNRSTS